MGKLSYFEVVDRQLGVICEECLHRLTIRNKRVRIEGQSDYFFIDPQMWSDGNNVWHATLVIDGVTVVLCKLKDNTRG